MGPDLASSVAGVLADGGKVPTADNRLRLAFVGSYIEVVSEHGAILDDLRRAYRHVLNDTQRMHDCNRTVRLVVSRSDQGERGYRISEDDSTVADLLSRDEVLPLIERAISERALTAREDEMLLHAGVVGDADGAMLLPAPHGAGKSTLVAALVMAGFQYLSDEVAVVDADTLLVDGFPRPICLRAGGWAAIRAIGQGLEAVSARLPSGEVLWYVTPPLTSRPPARRRVRNIVLPRYCADQRTSLSPISRGEAFAELVEQSVRSGLAGRRRVEAMLDLTRGTDCCRMAFNDLGAAVHLLTALR